MKAALSAASAAAAVAAPKAICRHLLLSSSSTSTTRSLYGSVRTYAQYGKVEALAKKLNAAPPVTTNLSAGQSQGGSPSAASEAGITSRRRKKWMGPRPPKPPSPNTKLHLPEGHGENLWVWTHIEAGHTVYMLKPYLNPRNVQTQLPYTGKKLVPSKIRKDYWRCMAQVKFKSGQGEIGRRIYQMLIELKRRHELEWDKSQEELFKISRRERGEALNDQKANVVADLAAVLGEGRGKANKLVTHKGDEQVMEDVTIYWANAQDRLHAKVWNGNVKHFLGIPSLGPVVDPVGMDAPPPTPPKNVEAEAGAEKADGKEKDGKEGPGEDGDDGKKQKKKGMTKEGAEKVLEGPFIV
ncbi:transcriptional regulation of mitochondrial recombination-domain-containing protein [Apodospora peruviana]|uniref:Large ribosomal subunit protein mL67 n=1 Tax=Apodospora peruviana TaxID=516989 RepID=A0AAE0HV37_9PEZI|nr:transcriptional regulation of mitochondrial recombination-domain-containing protein [Apodospora peruviana]